VRDSALAALEPLVDTSAPAKPVFVANTLAFPRREVIKLPGGRPALVDVPGLRLRRDPTPGTGRCARP